MEAIEQEDNTGTSTDEDTSDNHNNKVGSDQVIQIELEQPRISLETVIEVENH